MSVPDGARLVTDPHELEVHFGDIKAAHIYALVDLEEPFWSGGTWYMRDGAAVGIVEMPGDDWQAVYAVSTRAPQASLSLVADLVDRFPPGQFVTASAGLQSALAGRREVRWCRPHMRYRLADPTAVPGPDPRVQPLDRSDLTHLQNLYAEPDSAFLLPHMVDDSTFVGVFDGDRLVAAAGTHVVSESKRIAAIGAVYVSPYWRGMGLGRAVTAGVVHRLAGRVDLIGLNVAADNKVARSVYEAIGFVPLLTYDEAELA